jgi:hypothetical protein
MKRRNNYGGYIGDDSDIEKIAKKFNTTNDEELARAIQEEELRPEKFKFESPTERNEVKFEREFKDDDLNKLFDMDTKPKYDENDFLGIKDLHKKPDKPNKPTSETQKMTIDLDDEKIHYLEKTFENFNLKNDKKKQSNEINKLKVNLAKVEEELKKKPTNYENKTPSTTKITEIYTMPIMPAYRYVDWSRPYIPSYLTSTEKYLLEKELQKIIERELEKSSSEQILKEKIKTFLLSLNEDGTTLNTKAKKSKSKSKAKKSKQKLKAKTKAKKSNPKSKSKKSKPKSKSKKSKPKAKKSKSKKSKSKK